MVVRGEQYRDGGMERESAERKVHCGRLKVELNIWKYRYFTLKAKASSVLSPCGVQHCILLENSIQKHL